MATLTWSLTARRDLQAVFDYVSDDDPDRAIAFVDGLIAAAERLREFPRSGRVLPEFERSGWREVVANNYRIIYSINGQRVVVHAVLHGSMSLLSQAAKREWPTN